MESEVFMCLHTDHNVTDKDATIMMDHEQIRKLRADLGRAARRRIEERFDRDRNIHSYVELFAGP